MRSHLSRIGHSVSSRYAIKSLAAGLSNLQKVSSICLIESPLHNRGLPFVAMRISAKREEHDAKMPLVDFENGEKLLGGLGQKLKFEGRATGRSANAPDCG